MTLTLTKRLAKGSPLSAAEHDANLGAIEVEVNAKVGTSDSRLSDARTPTSHTQAISTVTGLQAALDAKAAAADLSALTTTVGGKVGTGDSRLTDRRGIATGDYGAFTVASGGAATLATAAVVATIAGVDAGQAEDIVEAIQEQIEEVITGQPFPAATLAEVIVGTDDDVYPSAAAMRHMGVVKAKTYASTVTLVLDGHRTADGDGADSDTLLTTIACTGNCTLAFNSINANLVRQRGEVIFSNSGGGARTITLTGTANSITVSLDTGVTSPGLGSTAGNTLEVVFVIVSTTAVRIESVRAYT